MLRGKRVGYRVICTNALSLIAISFFSPPLSYRFYPIGQAPSIAFDQIPSVVLGASNSIRKLLAVHSYYSFYWGSSDNLDSSPIYAAVYNEWLILWASSRPFELDHIASHLDTHTSINT